MATYTRVSPATLANFAPTINDPADTEAANLLAQVDLQTRRFVYDFLATKFDATSGYLLAAAIDSATSLLALINGSTGNSGTQRQIVQGTISTVDLRDLAISTTKLAANAVTAAKITDATITATQLADSAIATAKIAANAVTQAKLGAASVGTTELIDANVTTAKLASGAVVAASIGSDAVITAKIQDAAVTTAKHALNSVDGTILVAGSSAGQILITGDSPFNFAVKTMSGDATIDKNGVISLATSAGQCEVEEQAAVNVAGGAATATTWHVRGTATSWVKTFDTAASVFLTITGSKLILAAGTYLIDASAPGYKVDNHRIRINRYNSGDFTQQIIYGSSEYAPAANLAQTRSTVLVKMTFAAGDYFKVEHYCLSAEATDGLGLPVNATGVEIYTKVRIQKIG